MPDSHDRLMRLAEEVAGHREQLSNLTDDIRQLAHVPEDLATLKERVGAAVRQANTANKQLESLEALLRQREEQQRRERRVDRQWAIGTALASAGLVIAALTLLINHL